MRKRGGGGGPGGPNAEADLQEPLPEDPGGDRRPDLRPPEEEDPPTGREAGYVGGAALLITLTEDVPVGRFRGEVAVTTNQPAPYDEVVLSVVGTRRGPFTFLPVRRPGQKWLASALAFELGTFPAEEGTKGTLQLFVEGMDGPLEITNVRSDEPAATLTVRRDESFPADSGRQKLFLDFAVEPGAPPATHIRDRKVTILADTNHPAAGSMKIFLDYASYAK